MYKIRVNNSYNFEVGSDKNQTSVNNNQVNLDICKTSENHIHVLYNHKSYRAEIVEVILAEKKCILKINNNIYHLELKDQYDNLLQRLGLDNVNAVKLTDLKAPMPGMVLKIMVNSGQEVKKGDSLLVLEAMKMENIIKSPADLIIKSVQVKITDKVEKGQVMIKF